MFNPTQQFESSHGGAPAKADPASRIPSAAADSPQSPIVWVRGSILRGRNIHHVQTVACVHVQIRRAPALGPGFEEAFRSRFLDAAEVPPTAPAPETVIRALRLTGSSIPQLLLHAILAIERRLAFRRHDFVPIVAVSASEPDATGQIEIVWSTQDPQTALSSAQAAIMGMNELLTAAGDSRAFDAEFARLRELAQRRAVSTTTSVILLAAHRRGLHSAARGGPTVQLGQGAAQRMAYASVPDGGTLASARLSRHKRRTARTLAQIGLPVPRHYTARSLEQASAAAARVGYPVVVKPLRGKQAMGVTVGVRSPEALEIAFGRAAEFGALIEELVVGSTYRLLVIGNRLAAALKIAPPTVTGNGIDTVRELIATLNRDPLRNEVRLFPVEIDDELTEFLGKGGHRLEDVPAAGEEIALRSACNVATGGVHTDVTNLVHPSHASLALRAAQAIGLEVAGIDFVSRDIALPADTAGTKILEVNARPGLCMHTFPRFGAGQDVGNAMLDLMFPPGDDGHIPTALVIGSRGAGATARVAAGVLDEGGVVTGVVTRKRVTLRGASLGGPDLEPHEAVRRLWRDPSLQALVVATDPHRAVARGLVVDSADVVALLSPDEARDKPSDYEKAVELAIRAARKAVLVEAGNRHALSLVREAAQAGTLGDCRILLVTSNPTTGACEISDATDAEPIGQFSASRSLASRTPESGRSGTSRSMGLALADALSGKPAEHPLKSVAPDPVPSL